MKRFNVIAFAVALIMALSACQNSSVQTAVSTTPTPVKGQIYLYGESHGVERILNKELELWQGYYNDNGMRHLFVEYPYYTAEFLNRWMQADDDEILNAVYADWAGTQGQIPQVKTFFQEIKRLCPETIFHGTDVGHQFQTTGQRYLKYLRENGLEDSEQYQMAQTCIEQGKHFAGSNGSMDYAYRENAMAENFRCAFDKLNGESVMGIYGSAHIGLDKMDFTNTVPSMANQIREFYGEALHSEDLRNIPVRVDKGTLWVCVDKEDLISCLRQTNTEIDTCGRFADAPFLV